LAPLTAVFGGYAFARYWHFVSMITIVLLAIVHVFMVIAVDPYSMRSMITGKYDDSLAPEERNARPFYHLLPRWRGSARAIAGDGMSLPPAAVASAAVPAPSLPSMARSEEQSTTEAR
jgi:hypothetical protein